jgi:hypothetical protein
MTAAYDRRRARREADRERALMGESLATFHARETAKPPTTAEIFAKNRTDKTVCPVTGDLFATAGTLPRKAMKALRRRCGVGT